MNPQARCGALIAAVLAFAAAAGGVAAQPSRAPTPARPCFLQRNLTSWKEAGDRQVYLKVGVNDIYELALDAPCWNLRWAERLGIENRGSSSVCTGDTVILVVPDRAMGTDRCFARVLRRLTPEQAAALPPKQRP
jgi:hypothetical protein